MTEKRTYNNPGDCDKCGYTDITFAWMGPTREATGEYLEAICERCYYMWKVTAKDEEGGTND